MTKRIIVSMATACGCLALIVLAIGMGHADPTQPSPVGRGAFCELPCWRGIHPGETLIAQANRILMAQGYTAENSGVYIHYRPPGDMPGCTVRLQQHEAFVTETRLSGCPDLDLGDVLAALGGPDQLTPNLLTVGFEGGAVRVQLDAPDCGESLSPHTAVQYVSLSQPNGPAAAANLARWQGFALSWRYWRALPNFVVLAC
ncbi:MAG: hypothetical protein K8J31_29010 [Anaerolineae bacterium]|nr:hypothetical protein [Anaerolineae bacterium]